MFLFLLLNVCTVVNRVLCLFSIHNKVTSDTDTLCHKSHTHSSKSEQVAKLLLPIP